MPPKLRVASAKKKLTKAELAQQQAELEAAQKAAEEARQAREEAERREEEERRREEEDMIVREKIDVPHNSDADVRAVLMRSFGHLYPAPTPPILPTVAVEPLPAAAVVPIVEDHQPTTKRSNSRPPSATKPKRSAPAATHAPTTPAPAPAASSSSSLAKASPRTPSGGARKTPSPSPHTGASAGAPSHRRKLTHTEQAALLAEEAAAAEAKRIEEEKAAAEYERLHPKFTPETEAQLASLQQSVASKKAYTAAAEASILDYYASQVSSDAAEGERLVSGFNLHRGVDLPDEERRLKSNPISIPIEPTITSPSKSIDKQVLSASGLIDLQAILDRQQARMAAVNKAIRYVDPESVDAASHTKKKHRVSRKAALETGVEHRRSQASLADGDSRPSTGKVSRSRASLERIKLVKGLMPFSEIVANQAILAHMKTLQNFSRNPRYDERNNRQGGPGGKGRMIPSSTMKSFEEEKQPLTLTQSVSPSSLSLSSLSSSSHKSVVDAFLLGLSPEEQSSRLASCLTCTPTIVWFEEVWSPMSEGTITRQVEIKNVGTLSRRIRVEPPAPALGQVGGYFRVDQPKYHGGGASATALLAPGMSCTITVHFRPDALCDYSSVFRVVTETGTISIPLHAIRPRGILSLPSELHVGVCASGDTLTRTLSVTNIGSSKSSWWMMTQTQFQQIERKREIRLQAASSPRHRPILDGGASNTSQQSSPPMFTSKAFVAHLQNANANAMSSSNNERRSTSFDDGPDSDSSDFDPASADDDDGTDAGVGGEFDELDLDGIFKISPASWTLEPGESIDLLVEYTPTAPDDESHVAAVAGGDDVDVPSRPYVVQDLSRAFLIVQEDTRVTRHSIFGKTCEIRLELESVDGCNLEDLKKLVRSNILQRREDACELRKKLNNPSRTDFHLDVEPLQPPPYPASLDTLGPQSPREESLKNHELIKTLTLTDSAILPNTLDRTIQVEQLAGMITPREGRSRIGTAAEGGRGSSATGALSTPSHIDLDDPNLHAPTTSLIRSFNSLVFDDTEIGGRVCKTVTLRNRTPLPVPFHWSLASEDGSQQFGLQAEQQSPSSNSLGPFQIQPSFGTFEAHSTQTFTFVFEPTQTLHFRQRATFVVENVPEETGRHAHDKIDNDDHAAHSSDIAGHSTFLDTLSATRRLRPSSLVDLSYFSLTMIGFGRGVDVILTPSPLTVFEAPLPIGRTVRKVFRLANRSALTHTRSLPYTFDTPRIKCQRRSGISDHMFQPDNNITDDVNQGEDGSETLLTVDDLSLTLTPSSGDLAPGEIVEVTVEFTPRLLGSYRISLDCAVDSLLKTSSAASPDIDAEFESGSGVGGSSGLLSTSIAFTTVGPRLQIAYPETGLVDFGLVNFGTPNVTSVREVRIKNISTQPAEWNLNERGFRPSMFRRVCDASDGDYAPASSIDADVSALLAQACDIPPGGVLTFSPSQGILPPGELQSVTITFTPTSTTPLRTSIEMHIRNTPLPFVQMIEARAQVQAPLIICHPTRIELDRTIVRQLDDAEEERKRIAQAEREAAEAETERQRIAAEEAATAREKHERQAAEAKARIDAQIAAAAEAKAKAEQAALDAKARKKMTPSQLKKERLALEAAAKVAAAEAAAKEAADAASAAATQRDLTDVADALESVVQQIEHEEATVGRPLSAFLPQAVDEEKVNPSILKQSSILCVRVPRVFEVRLKNLSNLPAVFRWSVVGEGSEGGAPIENTSGDERAPPAPFDVRFHPVEGSLEGREERAVTMSVTAFRSGPLHLLLACDIEGVDKPIGVEILAMVKDITVSYHALEPAHADELESSLNKSWTSIFAHSTNTSPRTHQQQSHHHRRTSSAASITSALRSSRSMRSVATDFSTVEGVWKLEHRTQILDAFIPARQYHSKITTKVEKRDETIDPLDEIDQLDMIGDLGDVGDGGVGSDAPTVDGLNSDLSTECIVPTSSGLPSFDFGRTLEPGTRKTICLILRNHTIIPTKFTAKVALRPPSSEKVEEEKRQMATSPIARAIIEKKAAKNNALSAIGVASQSQQSSSASLTGSVVGSVSGTHRRFGSTTTSSAMGSARGSKKNIHSTAALTVQQKVPTLTSAYESTQRFQSAAGQKSTAASDLISSLRAVIPTGQGVAFELSASSGLIAPYSTFRLDVTVLTDACGIFKDELTIHIRGLGPITIPLSVGVSGLAVRVSKRTLGVLFPESPSAPRNKIEKVQRQRSLLDAVSESKDDSNPNTADLVRESSLQPDHHHAALVQHGFDQHPKVYFRPILVHVDEASRKRLVGAPTDDAHAFERRLTYNTSSNGEVASRAHTVLEDQIRNVIIDNSGPTDIKIVWKQYDLRSIDHHKIVDVTIEPVRGAPVAIEVDADGETDEDDRHQIVAVDVERYVYPANGDAIARQLTAAGASASGGASTTAGGVVTGSLDTARTDVSSDVPPVPLFPFLLDPPELVIPARSSSTLRVIYDPTRLAHPSLIDSPSAPSHDLNFIEGIIYIPEGTNELKKSTPASQDATPRVSQRTKKLNDVLTEIGAFESKFDAAMPLSDEDEDGDCKEDGSLSSRSQPVVGNTSSLLRANRIAKFFAPKPVIQWIPAPEQISDHRFRLVLSARTIVPNLKVDKSKGRIKFVCQAPNEDAAINPSSSLAAGGLSKTLVRPVGASVNGVSTVVIAGATRNTSSSSNPLVLTKMLPLTNTTDVTLTFQVRVTPSERFTLLTPPSTTPPNVKPKPGQAVIKPKGTLPLQGELGWKITTPTSVGSKTLPFGASDVLTLLPGDSMVLPIRFRAPAPSDTLSWPLVPRFDIEGRVDIFFSNGSGQAIPISAELLRPALAITPTKHDFGHVHTIESNRSNGGGEFGSEIDEFGAPLDARARDFTRARQLQKLTLLFSNPSLVDAHWTMSHIPSLRPVTPSQLRNGELRASMHPATLKSFVNTEFDPDADCIDDPRVFVFERTAGVVPAGAGKLHAAARSMPSGVVTELTLTSESHSSTAGRNVSGTLTDGRPLRGSSVPEVIQRVPIEIPVQFRPTRKAMYKSVFRITCMHGAEVGETMEIELRGTGSYQEDIPI